MISEEMVDLVNEHNEVIATKSRREVIEKKLTNFRLVCAFMIHSDGRILIPRRALTKKLYPDALCLIGGFVQSGETYEQALTREVFEETGIVFDSLQCSYLGSANPWHHGAMGFVYAYQIKIKDKISFISDEFSELFWLTPEEIQQKIDAGEKVTRNMPILLSLFYKK